MPELGEIRKAKEIARIGRAKHIWHACIDCGKERWVAINGGQPRSERCRSCGGKLKRGEKGHSWKGGRIKDSDGYILIKLQPNDFFYPMAAKSGYVYEHRLVVAKALGRNLHSWEIVHHKDAIRNHNTKDNLQVVSDLGHKQLTILEQKIDKLLRGNQELKEQVRLLQWHIKELEKVEIESNKLRR